MKRILKKSICLLAVFTLLVASTAVSFAAKDAGVVSYEGQVEKFLFKPGSDYSKTDLFGKDFKGVMPGDTLTDTVTVRNNASDKVNVEIFMRALGATDLQEGVDGSTSVSQQDSAYFLDELGLIVYRADNKKELFDSAASETAQLTDWVSLGTFESGEEVDLTVELTVPIEMDSDYAAKIGALDWQFKVIETPIPTETKTGDDMNLILPIALMGVAALTLIIILATRRRKQEQ